MAEPGGEPISATHVPDPNETFAGVFDFLRTLRDTTSYVTYTLPADHPFFPSEQALVTTYRDKDHKNLGTWGITVGDEFSARLGTSRTPTGQIPNFFVEVKGPEGYKKADEDVTNKAASVLGSLTPEVINKVKVVRRRTLGNRVLEKLHIGRPHPPVAVR